MKYVVDSCVAFKWLVPEVDTTLHRFIESASTASPVSAIVAEGLCHFVLDGDQVFHDCLYVSLAEQEHCELVTSDDKLIKEPSKDYPFRFCCPHFPDQPDAHPLPLPDDCCAILDIAADRRAVRIGFLFVISAALARDYDGEDLVHESWHLLIPIVWWRRLSCCSPFGMGLRLPSSRTAALLGRLSVLPRVVLDDPAAGVAVRDSVPAVHACVGGRRSQLVDFFWLASGASADN